MNDIRDQISTFILTEVNPDLHLERLEDDEPLIESGIVDSLGVLKILAFLDETFGVDISSEHIKLENFDTLRSICALMARAQAS